ncbi:unnamed protein product [Phytophthora fragariaefolia]|uniref:Unnamed protein product n=1 Tax=Phytophthora fragariaefolia TaxID=1490495 RepID=A0A9W6XTK3_9STRA|nr:unnamed protein product [Phytophthora fragariaefolia]
MEQCNSKIGAKFLLDCGATTVYVPRSFAKKKELRTHVYTERMIKVKLGDNHVGEAVLELVKITVCLDGAPNYQCVAVVFDIPDEFDCVLGMPFFVDVRPEIDWKRRCFKMDDSVGSSAVETSTPSGECSLTIGSELHSSAVASESSRTISRDSCRAVVPETLLEGEVKVNERPADVVEKFSKREKKNAKVEAMFTLGVVDSEGVQTKYITRKKLRKFRRLPAKDQPEHDFMIALTNDTIKAIQRDVRRRDEPENVGTEKAKRFLQTDWESFKKNPAYPVIVEYKDSVFTPELPDGLPMERDIEHRINVKNPNIAMYRQQWPRMGLDELKSGNTKRVKDTALSACMAFVKCEQVEFDYVKRCIEQDTTVKCFVSVLDMFGMYLALNAGRKAKTLARNSAMQYFRQCEIGKRAEVAVIRFLCDSGVGSRGSGAVLKHLRALRRSVDLNARIERH